MRRSRTITIGSQSILHALGLIIKIGHTPEEWDRTQVDIQLFVDEGPNGDEIKATITLTQDDSVPDKIASIFSAN